MLDSPQAAADRSPRKGKKIPKMSLRITIDVDGIFALTALLINHPYAIICHG